jgi:hypothetical protein
VAASLPIRSVGFVNWIRVALPRDAMRATPVAAHYLRTPSGECIYRFEKAPIRFLSPLERFLLLSEGRSTLWRLRVLKRRKYEIARRHATGSSLS